MHIKLIDIIYREVAENEDVKVKVQDRSLRSQFSNSSREDSISSTSPEASSHPFQYKKDRFELMNNLKDKFVFNLLSMCNLF